MELPANRVNENNSSKITVTPIEESQTENVGFNFDDINDKIKLFVFEEINYRIIHERDKHALDILSEAKRKLKETLESQKNSITWTIIAMKGFYLAASIALGHWNPEYT